MFTVLAVEALTRLQPALKVFSSVWAVAMLASTMACRSAGVSINSRSAALAPANAPVERS